MLKIKKILPFALLSFLLASFVWFLAKQGAESVEISFFVPLVFINLPPHMQITSDVPSVVSVSGRILRRYSNNFNPSALQATVDLTNAKSGLFQYTLTEQNIPISESVSVARIIPGQIELMIEEIVEKQLTIRARYQGQLQAGKILQGIEISPDTVKVKGPQSVLQGIESVFTNEIDLQNINRSIVMLVSLDLPDPNIQFLDNVNDSYIANVKVSSLPVRKRFDDVAILLLNQSHVSVTNPTAFNLFVEGPEELMNNLESSQIYGTIDLLQYEPGSYWVQPEAILPEGISLLQQWPKISLWVKPTKLSQEQE